MFFILLCLLKIIACQQFTFKLQTKPHQSMTTYIGCIAAHNSRDAFRIFQIASSRLRDHISQDRHLMKVWKKNCLKFCIYFVCKLSRQENMKNIAQGVETFLEWNRRSFAYGNQEALSTIKPSMI